MKSLSGRNLFAVAWLLWSAQLGGAQGTFVALNTGGGQPLLSIVRPLFVDAGLAQPQLQFDFGFATDEVSLPGNFLDSFTVTIQGPNQSPTAVYLTADASGTVVAPPTPGTLPLDPSTINTSAIAYPSLQPVLADRHAFLVNAAIPAQFVGGPISVFFDLFDNQDPLASQAWFDHLQIVSVPEPQMWAFLGMGILIGWGVRRFKR